MHFTQRYVHVCAGANTSATCAVQRRGPSRKVSAMRRPLPGYANHGLASCASNCGMLAARIFLRWRVSSFDSHTSQPCSGLTAILTLLNRAQDYSHNCNAGFQAWAPVRCAVLSSVAGALVQVWCSAAMLEQRCRADHAVCAVESSHGMSERQSA